MQGLIENYQKVNKLKRKIEEEIEKINNSYNRIENEITLSFRKQYLELEEREKNLKLELNTKVNNIKDELKDFLIKANDILLSCERIQKSDKKYERKNNNDIITLYYISEIYKNKKKAEEFLEKKIRNIEILFRSDKYLRSDDYYFNGIPIPKDVKAIKKGDQLYITWDIDDSQIKIFDTKGIKYSVLIKENDDEDYDRNSSDNRYF